jgi:hypothetical protein
VYASIRRYRIALAQVAEVAHRVDETFVPRLETLDGFVDYQVIDCGNGRLYSYTICRDRDSCEESAALATQFVGEELADIEIERLGVEMGEVLVSRARGEVLEPAHA